MPAESTYIFGACAVIALLDAEPGGEVVETLLTGERHRCVIHLLNVCEIYYHIYRSADQQRADKLRVVLEGWPAPLTSRKARRPDSSDRAGDGGGLVSRVFAVPLHSMGDLSGGSPRFT